MRPQLAAVLAAILVSCRTAGERPPLLVQPGAPGEATRVITVSEALAVSRIRPTASDVRFMQRMIGHHAQALEMTALLPSRTHRDDMRLLARRIEISQADEIAAMQRWLNARGETGPDMHAHHAPGTELMPGMLNAGQMSRLKATAGSDELNVQLQRRVSWPATSVVALAYVDQLTRTRAMQPDRADAIRAALQRVHRVRNSRQRGASAALDQLTALAERVDEDARGASGRDAGRLQALAASLRDHVARLR